jgi:alanyl-tRNA synthetase
VTVADAGDRRLTAPRRWQCRLPSGEASLPCGGTHVSSLAALASVTVDYHVSDDGTELSVRTTPASASDAAP